MYPNSAYIFELAGSESRFDSHLYIAQEVKPPSYTFVRSCALSVTEKRTNKDDSADDSRIVNAEKSRINMNTDAGHCALTETARDIKKITTSVLRHLASVAHFTTATPGLLFGIIWHRLKFIYYNCTQSRAHV